MAGNHAFNRTKDEYIQYLKNSCEVEFDKLTHIPNKGAGNSVLAVFVPNKSEKGKKRVSAHLRFKKTLSPFEFTDVYSEIGHRQPTTAEQRRWVIPLPHLGISMQILICAEALQGVAPLGGTCISIVCAFHARPEEFDRFLKQKSLTKGVGVLASEGKYGGSHVCVNNDKRNPSWWFGPPLDGKLKRGDAILIHEVPIITSPDRPGTVNPEKTERLVCLAAIVSADDTEDQYHTLREFQNAVNMVGSDYSEAKQAAFAKQLRIISSKYPKMTEAQEIKISALQRIAGAQQLSDQVFKAFGRDCMLTSSLSIIPDNAKQNDDISKYLPLSLIGLQKKMAAETYATVRLKLESGNLSLKTQLVCISAQAECLKFFGPAAAPGPVSALSRFLTVQKKFSRERVLNNLNSLLGTLIERYSGSSGWIFIAANTDNNKSGDLIEVVSHNVPTRTKRSVISVKDSTQVEAGICGLCYSKKLPVLIEDVDCTQYKMACENLMRSTKSVIAAPILDINKVIKGIVIIESVEKYSFIEPQKWELLADATQMLPELLIWEAIEINRIITGWHPDNYGTWKTEAHFNRLCETLATSVTGSSDVQSVCCTLWIVDWKKRYLYTRSTVRFNFEYISSMLLPLQHPNDSECDSFFPVHPHSWMKGLTSFTASVADSDEEMVKSGPISEQNGYHRPEKAIRMGLSDVVSVPVHEPNPPGAVVSRKRSTGVLSFYFFKKQHPEQAYSSTGSFPDQAIRMAEIIGINLREITSLKLQIAMARFHSRVSTRLISNFNFIDILREEICEVIGCQAMSIFVATLGVDGEPCRVKALYSADLSSEKLKTGALVDALRTIPREAEGYFIFRGITGFLARFPNSTIRKVDVADDYEIGSLTLPNHGLKELRKWAAGKIQDISRISEELILFEPGGLLMERSDTDLDHRRLLAASFLLPPRAPGMKDVAIIRLIRNSESRPFGPEDGPLLQAYMKDSATQIGNLYTKELNDYPDRSVKDIDYAGAIWNRKALLSILQRAIIEVNNDYRIKFGIDAIKTGCLQYRYLGKLGDGFLRTYIFDGIAAGRPTSVDRSIDKSVPMGTIEEFSMTSKKICLGYNIARAKNSPKFGKFSFRVVVPVGIEDSARRCRGLLSFDGAFHAGKSSNIDALATEFLRKYLAAFSRASSEFKNLYKVNAGGEVKDKIVAKSSPESESPVIELVAGLRIAIGDAEYWPDMSRPICSCLTVSSESV